MAERMTGRVQCAQLNLRFAFERDHVIVLNQPINRHIFECLGGLRVCRNRNVAAEMRFESIDAADMIRDLTLEYNKLRQGNITKELLEIVSGQMALS